MIHDETQLIWRILILQKTNCPQRTDQWAAASARPARRRSRRQEQANLIIQSSCILLVRHIQTKHKGIRYTCYQCDLSIYDHTWMVVTLITSILQQQATSCHRHGSWLGQELQTELDTFSDGWKPVHEASFYCPPSDRPFPVTVSSYCKCKASEENVLVASPSHPVQSSVKTSGRRTYFFYVRPLGLGHDLMTSVHKIR